MEIKSLEMNFFKWRYLIFNIFWKQNNLEDDTMNESQLQKIYNYPKYPRHSKIHSNKGFVNIDDGSMNGTHWTCFIVKDNKSF